MKSLIKGIAAAAVIWGLALVAVPHSQGIVRSLTTSANYRSPNQKVLFTGLGSTQLATAQATVPICTGANCGTTPSVLGSDSAMTVTLGTGAPATPFTVNFNGTWAAAPACVSAPAIVGTTKFVTSVVTSTTNVIVTLAAAPAASDKYHILCLGIQ